MSSPAGEYGLYCLGVKCACIWFFWCLLIYGFSRFHPLCFVVFVKCEDAELMLPSHDLLQAIRRFWIKDFCLFNKSMSCAMVKTSSCEIDLTGSSQQGHLTSVKVLSSLFWCKIGSMVVANFDITTIIDPLNNQHAVLSAFCCHSKPTIRTQPF